MSFLRDRNKTYSGQFRFRTIPRSLNLRMIGVGENAIAAEALLEELEETIRVILGYASLHEDLGKLEVLARVKKGAPRLIIDKGDARRLLFVDIVCESPPFRWSPTMWVVSNGEYVGCRVNGRASRLIEIG